MKKKLLILLFFGWSAGMLAQDKQIEAIAAYQMAEERFDSKNYADALKYLKTAKDALGEANSKMLYLEIQILEELGKIGPTYFKRLEGVIREFEKAPDIEQFSLEKRVEVAKIKMTLGEKIEENDKKRSIKNELAFKKEAVVMELLRSFPKVGISLDQFLEHPFASKIKAEIGSDPISKVMDNNYQYVLKVLERDDQTDPQHIIGFILLDPESKKVISYSVNVEIGENLLETEVYFSAERIFDFFKTDQQVDLFEHGKFKKLTSDDFIEGYQLKGSKTRLVVNNRHFITKDKYVRGKSKNRLYYFHMFVYGED